MGIKIGDVQRQERRGTAAEGTSANPTLKAGEIGVELDTHSFKIGDGVNVWTDLLYYYVPVLDQVFVITTASNETVDLPDATTTKARFIIDRSGAGTGKVLFTTQSSHTIDGFTAAEWYLEGKGKMIVYPYQGNWKVASFSDLVSIADGTSGSASYDDREVRKYADRSAEVTGRYSHSSINLATLTAGFFATSADLNAPYGYTLSTAVKSYVSPRGSAAPTAKAGLPTTTSVPLKPYRGDSAVSQAISLTWRVLGTW